MSRRMIYPVEKYTPQTWRFIVLGAVAYVAMLIVTWQVHTGWSIFFGILGFHLYLLCFLTGKPRHSFLKWTGILLAIFVGFSIFCWPNISWVTPLDMDRNLIYWSGEIHEVLKEYAADDDGQYPLDSSEILNKLELRNGYGLRNPYGTRNGSYLRYLGESNRTPEEPADALAQHSYTGEYLTEVDLEATMLMHHVEITDPEHVGNFTYTPRLERNETGEFICTGYTLVVYGLSMYSRNKYRNHICGGNSWEHVIMVVDSDGNRIEYH